jgi:hypothetical protein
MTLLGPVERASGCLNAIWLGQALVLFVDFGFRSQDRGGLNFQIFCQ